MHEPPAVDRTRRAAEAAYRKPDLQAFLAAKRAYGAADQAHIDSMGD